MTAGAYSIPEVQRLVATLVASKPGGRIAEIGTGYGEGAKAIAAALPAGATFVTVEIEPGRVAQARAGLAGTHAEVLEGDWRDHLPQRGPFDARQSSVTRSGTTVIGRPFHCRRRWTWCAYRSRTPTSPPTTSRPAPAARPSPWARR